MRPGVNERTFEFCYNAEFCRRHNALLATHPHIPTQNEEKDLGYDVEFQITHRNFTRSIFLQHKVAHSCEYRAGRNARFYDAHGGPYFRFPVDNDQHNTLVNLARDKGNAYYCAPKFHTSSVLERHFRAEMIARHSVLLNPLEVGGINDQEHHNITFGFGGFPRIMHSEPRYFEEENGGGEELPRLEEVPVDDRYVRELSEQLVMSTRDTKLERLLPRGLERRRPVQQAQYILSKIYDVSWILLP
jgi:hypothetical protein